MKQSIEFKSDLTVYKLPKEAAASPLFVFSMMYKSTQKTVHEERLVYDQSGMVSQLGGILSLFLGFSFFSLISDFLDFIAKKHSFCRKPIQPTEPSSPQKMIYVVCSQTNINVVKNFQMICINDELEALIFQFVCFVTAMKEKI